ncbi:helix-turn-helix domain-containing protein [Pseudoalteromonas aliena]|uniref:helix-turn-helix domain-containing protein n=1 Tax=Pseudoalteromonas aliena TaxID=247523 RepID=UPI0018695B50
MAKITVPLQGRTVAKANGKHLGRHKNETLHAQIKELFMKGMNKKLISETLNCSRTTVYRCLAS